MIQEEFKVTAECSQEYIGNPSVVTCTEEDSTYKLKGCEKKVFCYAPTVLGYRVDEKSLVMQAFDVTAKCADGFHGSAKVTACSKEGAYSVTGCTENLCTAPSTVGYAVKEVELREHSFKVTATCDTGYDGTAVVEPCKIHKGQYVLKGCTRDEVFCVAPTVTDGYDVTETDLRVDEFEVKAVQRSRNVQVLQTRLRPRTLSMAAQVQARERPTRKFSALPLLLPTATTSLRQISESTCSKLRPDVLQDTLAPQRCIDARDPQKR